MFKNLQSPLHGLAAAALFGVLSMGWVSEASPQCDVPLIAQQVATPPNVMILLDNSGSMNNVMWHEEYDPTVTYPGRFRGDAMYYVGREGNYSPRDWNWRWESSPRVHLIAGLHGHSGRYRGNYLNWLYWNATPDQLANIPLVTRQQVANSAVKLVLNEAPGLRYGITIFNLHEGGRVVAPCGTDLPTLENIVDSTPANTWTPTAETLLGIVEEFKRDDSKAPIQYECQKNFTIVVTDGIPTQDLSIPGWIGDQDGDDNEPGDCASIGFPEQGNSNCSDYLDDVAYYAAHTDLRPDLPGEQNLSVYTIGFGVRARLLEEAAINGNGFYREAWDLDTLTRELGAVVGDIVNRISAGSAVAVVSTETGNGTHLYRGKFMPGIWRGYLECYKMPYKQGERPVWEAGDLLRRRSPSSRTIFTSVNNVRVDFDADHLDVLQYFVAPDGPGSGMNTQDPYGPDLDNDFDTYDQRLGPLYDETHTINVINWVRGDKIDGYRDRRGWLLGDLVYSTPVIVGAPSAFFFDADYQAYMAAKAYRDQVVYVGANDGMLHAFDADTGEERWAYIPRTVLGKLEELASNDYCHLAFADLSPGAFDVEINGSWRTVVIGGLRTGGDSYFAIDVTNPDSPKVLWETSVSSISSSFTVPKVVRTQVGTYLWTGSGPDPSGQAVCSVIDVETGRIVLSLPMSNSGSINALTAPATIDYNGDGYTDYLYQGDLTGTLYKWDLQDSGHWTYGEIFDSSRPIQATPTLATDEEGLVNVYFGTGQYMVTSDIGSSRQQYFYCVRDDQTWNRRTPSDLENVGNTYIDAATGDGWYFALENSSGERVTEPAAIVEGVVYFTSFAPSNAPCSAGGSSWIYAVDYRSGSPIDSDDDDDIQDEDRSHKAGDGVASRPVINLVDEELIIQNSNADLVVQDLLAQPRRIMVRSWRERFEGMTPNDGTTQNQTGK